MIDTMVGGEQVSWAGRAPHIAAKEVRMDPDMTIHSRMIRDGHDSAVRA
jgi:hypothetical protein